MADVWSHLHDLVPRLGLRAVGITSLALGGGLAEAGALVALTSAASGLVDDAQVSIGPFDLGRSEGLRIGVALVVVRLVLLVASSTWSVSVASSTIERARDRLLDAHLHARRDAQQHLGPGQLQERLGAWVEKTAGAVEAAFDLSVGLATLVAFTSMAALIDPLAALSVLVAGALFAVLLRPATRLARQAAARSSEAAARYAGAAGQAEVLVDEVRTFGVETSYQAEIAAVGREAARRHRAARLMTMVNPHTYQTLTLLALLGAVAWLADGASDAEAVATVGAVVLLLVRSVGAGQRVLHSRSQLVALEPFVVGVGDEIARLETARRPEGTVDAVGRGRLELHDVAAGHDGDDVVRGVTLTVEAGSSLGIVGPSGAGKSTLASVLLRRVEPTRGQVLLDGVPLADITWASFSRVVSATGTTAPVIEGTVADNVAFHRSLPAGAVRAALAAAHLAEEVCDGPARVGPRSGPLSSGQRQRLALARALAADPTLLVLDEPTSALDVDNEALVVDTIAALAGRVTVVVVAHRYLTVSRCDSLLVLEAGAVTACGPREDVEGASPFVRRMMRDEALADGADVGG